MYALSSWLRPAVLDEAGAAQGGVIQIAQLIPPSTADGPARCTVSDKQYHITATIPLQTILDSTPSPYDPSSE